MPGNPSCIPCTTSASFAPRSALSAPPVDVNTPSVYTFSAPPVAASVPATPVAADCPCKRRKLLLAALALAVVYLLARKG